MNEKCNKLLEELHHKYYESVYSLCLTVAEYDPTAHELIEDCIQDAFVKAITSYSKYKDYNNPMGWIARVATNKLQSELRKRNRHVKVTPLYAPEKLADMNLLSDGIESELKQKDIARQIARIYDMLTTTEKTIFDAYFMDEKSVNQTAKETGLSVNSVRSGIRRIRKKARAAKSLQIIFVLGCFLDFSRTI